MSLSRKRRKNINCISMWSYMLAICLVFMGFVEVYTSVTPSILVIWDSITFAKHRLVIITKAFSLVMLRGKLFEQTNKTKTVLYKSKVTVRSYIFYYHTYNTRINFWQALSNIGMTFWVFFDMKITVCKMPGKITHSFLAAHNLVVHHFCLKCCSSLSAWG